MAQGNLEKDTMSSAADYAEYQRVVRWMEDEEARKRNLPVTSVRRALAREIGVSVGTLEYIRYGRLKGLQGRVERAIDAALVRFLKRQQDGLEHELAVANARLGRGNRSVVAKAEAARDALAALIDEARQ